MFVNIMTVIISIIINIITFIINYIIYLLMYFYNYHGQYILFKLSVLILRLLNYYFYLSLLYY